MDSLLFYVPYALVFFIDRVQAVRGVANPRTWRFYAGIAVTGIVAYLVFSHVHGIWGDIAFWGIWGIGYPASYIWNNSADTSGDAF